MKAKINDLTVVGTPIEIAVFKQLIDAAHNDKHEEKHEPKLSIRKGDKVSFKGFSEFPEDAVFIVAESTLGTFTLVPEEE